MDYSSVKVAPAIAETLAREKKAKQEAEIARMAALAALVPKNDTSAFINMPKVPAAGGIGASKSTAGLSLPVSEGDFIAKEREKEMLRAKLEKQIADEKAAKDLEKKAALAAKIDLANKGATVAGNDINLADPYGNAMPDYDTSGHAALAESMQGAGIKNLSGELTDEAKVQKYQDTIEAGRLPKPDGFDKVAYESARKQAEDRIPDSQAAIDVKSPASSASEIANAPPDRVGDVIAKLKEEEKKGGPNFFDVLEAAAAGWNGKIPMYVQKQIAEEEQADQLAKMQAASELDANAYAKELADKERMQDEGFAFEAQQAEADRKNRLQLAGLGSVGSTGTSRLSLGGFMGGGK